MKNLKTTIRLLMIDGKGGWGWHTRAGEIVYLSGKMLILSLLKDRYRFSEKNGQYFTITPISNGSIRIFHKDLQ